MGLHETSGVDDQQDLSVDMLNLVFVELRITHLHGLRLYHQRGVEPLRLFAEGVGCAARKGDQRWEYVAGLVKLEKRRLFIFREGRGKLCEGVDILEVT